PACDPTPERDGWRYSWHKGGVRPAGGTVELATGADELHVLPLAGGCAGEVEGQRHELTGRPDVFTAVTDYLYLPRDTTARLSSAAGGTVALPTARAERRPAVSYQDAGRVRTELRGAGQCSRQVNNYALGNDVETDHLLV